MPADPITLEQLENLSAHNYVHNLKDQLQRAVYARSEAAFAAGDAARDALRTRAAMRRRQRAVRAAFAASLGGLPPMDTPLNVRTTGTVKEADCDIENLIFESRPKTYVTANLYLPHGITAPRGAVLFLCGHMTEGKHADGFQAVCRHFVKAGLVVLAQDPVGQGERHSYYEPALGAATVKDTVVEHDHAGWQCLPLGDAIARYFLHDAMRGVDVLCARREVDPRRIGVTGASGGGTQTCLMMLGDPRIAAAAPVVFLMNRRTYMYGGGAQDAEQIWPGLSALGIDHEDILIAMCPRPVCAIAARFDFFPIEGVRTTVGRCRRLWAMAGRPANLELFEERCTHSYSPAMARAATRFFSRHLLGREARVDSAAVGLAPGRRLWCTASGQVRGEIPRARAVYEENQDRLRALERSRREVPAAARGRRLRAWLRGRIVAGRGRVPPNLRCYARINRCGDLLVDLGFWWSQGGILNEGLLFRHFRDEGRRLPVTLAVWDEGTHALCRHWSWIRGVCAAGRAALVLDVTGVGTGEPNALNAHPPRGSYGVLRKLDEDLCWLGDSLCATRAWDVLRARDAIGEWPGVTAAGLRVHARGRQGVYAELACAVDRRLPRPEVVDPLPDYADWVRARHYEAEGWRALILPGMLRYGDLADLRRGAAKPAPRARSARATRLRASRAIG